MSKRSNRADRLRSILLEKLSVCVLSDPKQTVRNAYGLHLPIRSASTITIPRKLNQKGGGAGHDSDFLLTNDDVACDLQLPFWCLLRMHLNRTNSPKWMGYEDARCMRLLWSVKQSNKSAKQDCSFWSLTVSFV